MDAIAVAQGSPGPVAVNTSIYVGYKIKGLPGAISATLGTVLPSLLIILAIAMFFYQYRENAIIDKVFLGIRPAVVALILSAVYKMMKKSKFGYKRLLISLGTVLIIVFFSISPIYLIIAAGIGGIVYNKVKVKE